MIKAAICEDETAILEHISALLKKEFSKNSMVLELSKYNNAISLLEDISSGTTYQIYFLDIEMPGLDGLDFSRKLRQIDDKSIIIFISNKSELVYQSFEVRPFRFIRKNHLAEELSSLITSIKKELNRKDNDSITLECGQNKVYSFNVKDIVYVESMRRMWDIHTKDDVTTIVYKLSDIAELLKGHGFIQSHRSYLVNYRYIFSINHGEIVLDDKESIPISRGNLDKVKEEFHKYMMEN